MGDLVNFEDFRDRPGRRPAFSSLPWLPGMTEVSTLPSAGAYFEEAGWNEMREALTGTGPNQISDEEFNRKMGVVDSIPMDEFPGAE